MTRTFRILFLVSVFFCLIGLGAALSFTFLSLFLACGTSLLLLLTHSLRRAAFRMRELDRGAVVLHRSIDSQRPFVGQPINVSARISTSQANAPDNVSGGLVRIVARQSRILPVAGDADSIPARSYWIRSLSSRRPMVLDYKMSAATAGTIKVPPMAVSFLDEWGLFEQEKELNDDLQVEVWPTGMRSLLTKPHRVPMAKSMMPGIHQVKRAGMGSEMIELRPFHPNDPSRKISWPVTARKGTLMIREVETEVPVSIVVLFNVDDSMRAGPRGGTAYDKGFELLLALIDASERVRDPIGVCVCTEDGERFDSRYVPPSASRLNRYRILKTVLSCRAGLPDTNAIDEVSFKEVMTAHFRKTLWSGASLFGKQKDVLRAGLTLAKEDRTDAAADDLRILRDYAWLHGLPIPRRSRDFAREEDNSARPGQGIDAVAQALSYVRRRTSSSSFFVIVSALPHDAAGVRKLTGELSSLRADHHQAMVAFPTDEKASLDSYLDARELWTVDSGTVPTDVLDRTMGVRNREWLDRTRFALSRIGVPLLPVGMKDTVRQVMSGVNRVRREAGAHRW